MPANSNQRSRRCTATSPRNRTASIISRWAELWRSDLGYPAADLDRIPSESIDSFAGVGHYFHLARIQEGETVVDFGSGSGMDTFVAALKVGANGKVIGVDMTDAQRQKAEGLRDRDGFTSVTYVKGYIEEVPLPDGICRRHHQQRRLQPLARQAKGLCGSSATAPTRRTPGYCRHRHRPEAARNDHLQHDALGRLHRRSRTEGRLPLHDRGGRPSGRQDRRQRRLPIHFR